MKLYITFTKKNLAAITAAVIIMLIVAAQAASARTVFTDGSTNAKRMEYIRSIGCSVDDNIVRSKTVIIPENFSDVYENYNKIQKKAGFDLSDYMGREASVYTYSLSDEAGKELNLIVCDGVIIGGDISEVSFKGSMEPLIKLKSSR